MLLSWQAPLLPQRQQLVQPVHKTASLHQTSKNSWEKSGSLLLNGGGRGRQRLRLVLTTPFLMFSTSPDHRALNPPSPRGPSSLHKLRLTEDLSRCACSRAGSSGKPGKHLRFQMSATRRAQGRAAGPGARCPRHPRLVTPGEGGQRENSLSSRQVWCFDPWVFVQFCPWAHGH